MKHLHSGVWLGVQAAAVFICLLVSHCTSTPNRPLRDEVAGEQISSATSDTGFLDEARVPPPPGT